MPEAGGVALQSGQPLQLDRRELAQDRGDRHV
jgi:hypothetical protein